jgi:hypothetical protein
MILSVVGISNICKDCMQELQEAWVEKPDGSVQKIYFCGCVLSREEAEKVRKRHRGEDLPS